MHWKCLHEKLSRYIFHIRFRKNLMWNLNAYIIPAKEHQVVNGWAADEIKILKTFLCKYWEYIPLMLFELRMNITNIDNTST